MPDILSRIPTGLALFSLLAMLSGCHAHDDGDVALEACDERAEAGTPITAATDATADAPEVVIGDEPYLVTIPDGSTTGYLRLEIEAPETFAIIFAGDADVVTGLYRLEDGTPATYPLTSAGALDACPDDLKEHFDVDFETAGTYLIELTSVQPAWLFLSDGAGHADEH